MHLGRLDSTLPYENLENSIKVFRQKDMSVCEVRRRSDHGFAQQKNQATHLFRKEVRAVCFDL